MNYNGCYYFLQGITRLIDMSELHRKSINGFLNTSLHPQKDAQVIQTQTP